MRAEYINPFIRSVANAFHTMLGVEVTRGDVALKAEAFPKYPISGVIGLSGKAIGTVVLSLSETVALRATSSLLLTETTEISDEVVDAVGELTNMVAGGAKAELEEYKLSLSLPSVIAGCEHEIRFPSNVRPITVHFTTEWGDFALEVGLASVLEPSAT
ncbi:MAG: chemotaxis protein CheX [Planctomycetes bacterium]|nr:chemotaxis protein CheX [Planctomycetota bacterium]